MMSVFPGAAMLWMILAACTPAEIVDVTPADTGTVPDSPDTGESEDTEPPEDTGESGDASGGDTGDTAPPAEADCTDGVDNDLDGLIDCEDGDCLASCTEECTDEADNDLDGLVDCGDDDCWGTATCPVRYVRVSGGSLHRQDTTRRSSSWVRWSHTAYGGGSSTLRSSTSTAGLRASGITGTAWIVRSSGTQTCTWQLDHATAWWSTARSPWDGTSASGSARSGFASSGACGLDSTILPPLVDQLRPGSPSVWVMDDAGQQRQWYRGAATTSTASDTSWTRSDTWDNGSSFGSSSSTRSRHAQTWTLLLEPGDQVLRLSGADQ